MCSLHGFHKQHTVVVYTKLKGKKQYIQHQLHFTCRCFFSVALWVLKVADPWGINTTHNRFIQIIIASTNIGTDIICFVNISVSFGFFPFNQVRCAFIRCFVHGNNHLKSMTKENENTKAEIAQKESKSGYINHAKKVVEKIIF